MKKLSFFLMAMILSFAPALRAADVTETIAMKKFGGLSTSSYENVTKTGTSDKGTEMVAYAFNPTTGQVRGNKTAIAGASITSKDDSKNWSLYNTQAMPGAIKSIKVTQTATDAKFQNSMYVALGTTNQGAVTTVSGAQKHTTATTTEFTFDIDETQGYTYFKLLSNTKFTSGSVKGVVVTVTYVTGNEDPDATMYTVTTKVNDETMGTVTGAGEYAEGKTATLTANPNAGYKFVNWSNGETANPLKLTVTENVEITANFEAIPPMTCAEAAATASGETVVLNPFDVVYVVKDAGYIYIKDESGVALIYDFNLDDQLKAGDHVEGFVGTSSPFKGLPEIKPTVSFADLKVTPGTAPEATVFETVPTKEDVNKYVVFKGVKLTSNISYTTASATNATISVGGKNVTLRNNFKLSASLTSGSTYDIYAFVAVYDSNLQMYYASSVDVSPERTITATVNPAETGTVTGAGTYKEGKMATLTATPAEGYAFTCWTEGEDTVFTAANYSFKVAADRALVANFAKKTYNVTVTAENGTVAGAGEYEENAEATLTATPAEGYEFTCWTSGEDTVSTENPYTFTVTADTALVANFEKAAPTTETVYFINTKKWAKVNAYAWNTNGNNGWPGAAATKETEQIAGYDVYSFTANAGQYANVIFNNKVGDTGSQTEDLVWTAGKYYWMGVAKNFAGATKEEAEATLAAPLPDAWNIVGDAGLMGKGWDLNAAENAMTLQADGTYLLEKKDITITAGSYEYKAAKDHGWDVSVPAGSSNQKLTISKSGIYDVTFVLDVTAKKLTATATLKKEAVVIPTVIIAGDMNSWNQTKDKFTMAADSLTATFKATLTAKSYAFKMIVGGAWLSDGKTITRAANSTKFTGANSSTNSTLKADIAGEYLFTWEYATKTLTVTYPELPVEYTVTATVNPAETGTVAGAGKYEEGKEATLTATPAEGYQFVNWTVGDSIVSTENPYKFTVTADLALVANFELIPPTKYNVTVTAENGTVEGAGEYEENAEATLTATPAEGYEFVNWTVGDSIVSTENPYKFTVTADLALVANFKEVVKAVEVNVTDATVTSGEWSIDLAGSWNDQALTIKLWQDNTQGFGSYAPNTETGYYILLGAKELTPTTAGVYADNGDGTFTFTCSATDGTTQYNITVTGTSGAQEVYYEPFELTNLAVTDNETFLVLEASDMNMGLEVMLGVNMDGTLMDASQILFGGEVLPILSSEPVTVTFNEELQTEVYTARVVVEHMGGPLGLELIMYAGGATSEPISVNVTGATAAVDEATDVLKITGDWDGIAFELRINAYDPAQTLYDTPQIAEFETEEVYATSSLVTVIKTGENIDVIGEFMSSMGDIYNVYVNAKFAAGPETGVDNINTTVAPVKVIENGQIFIISNGVKYNAQGAKL